MACWRRNLWPSTFPPRRADQTRSSARPEVWRKACAELQPGALLVSNSFPVEGIEPYKVVEVDDRRRTRLY